MSEPWIRAYMADMRADPKLYRMNADMRLALLHAYDLAKNGPGKVAELRSNDGRAMRERELRDMANVSGASTRKMFERWANVGLCELVEEGGDTLCTFPNLARRQGIDESARERKRRERERKRHGDVTPMSRPVSRQKSRVVSRPVTGENQKPEARTEVDPPNGVSTSGRTRKPDPIWDAFVATLGVDSEMTKSERGRLNAACKELRDLDADPRDVPRVASRLREKWGARASVTPGAIVGNWTATLAELPNGNGFKPLSREEYQRIADEREARTHDATTDEEIPF